MLALYIDLGLLRELPKAGNIEKGELAPLFTLPLMRKPSAARSARSAAFSGATGSRADGVASGDFFSSAFLNPGGALPTVRGGAVTAFIAASGSSFISHSAAAEPATTTISRCKAAKQSISTCSVQVPSARSGNEYVPSNPLIETYLFEPALAVTEAPGKGNPPYFTSPRWSPAISAAAIERWIGRNNFIGLDQFSEGFSM